MLEEHINVGQMWKLDAYRLSFLYQVAYVH